MILEKLEERANCYWLAFILLFKRNFHLYNLRSTSSRSGGPQNPKPEETIAWNAPFVRSPSLVRTFFSLQYDLCHLSPVRVTG